MAIQEIAQAFNPITGVFGTGQVQFFTTSGTWSVPPGIGKVRARVWGGGGANVGSGGGFSMETIYDLTGVTSVAVTVGVAGTSSPTTGGTSSFGSYCSATGGVTTGGAVGAGSGGDINYSGGLGSTGSNAGGGVASLFGNGGAAATTTTSTDGNGGNGASGGGAGTPSTNNLLSGGNGFLGTGGFHFFTNTGANDPNVLPTSGLTPIFSIDFIGTGGGGVNNQPGMNGGGGGGGAFTIPNGGFPGGGGGNGANGGTGLVIVEW